MQSNFQEEEIDIDLNAPETEEAAVKIQAAFRGHQVRKEMSDEKNPVSISSLDVDFNWQLTDWPVALLLMPDDPCQITLIG